MPGNEPDPDVPGQLKLMPEYGAEWGLWDGWLPYHQPPRLRAGPGPGGFPTPRSLGLTSQLEDRIWRWNEDWHRGFLAYGLDDNGTSADLGLPNGDFALPEWADGIDPAVWYREGRAIAASLADQLPGVTVRLRAIRYVCAPRLLDLTQIFGDDEFFTPLARRFPETPETTVVP